jgi:hypothetical protein
MNMLRNLCFLIVFFTIIIGCENEKFKLIEPELQHSTDTLIFNDTETKSFYLYTKPESNGKYEIISYPNWVKIDPLSGSFNNGICKVKITSKVYSNDAGIYTGSLIIVSTSGRDTIFLKREVDKEYFKDLIEKKHRIATDVVDAEYIRNKNLLAYISSKTPRLNIYNPTNDSINSISLTYIPTCLSVSPSGETVAIGHDGHITIVRLESLQVVKVIDMSCNANDIILSSNNWVYVFPEEDQWVTIRCVDLKTNTEYRSSYSISENSIAKLHPSGKYFYVSKNGTIEKFDFVNNMPRYLYSSDFPGYNFWFSDDGLRIFSDHQTVFKTSEDPKSDLFYNGKISTSRETINWLNYSNVSDKLFVIYGYPYLHIYDGISLILTKSIPLESFLLPNGIGGKEFYQPYSAFVFSHTIKNEIYVITKSTVPFEENVWAIEKINY